MDAIESPSSSCITITVRRRGDKESSALHTVVRITNALSGSAGWTAASLTSSSWRLRTLSLRH